MTQEQFNILVRAVVFSACTESCMDRNAMSGALDALTALLAEYPNFEDGLDFKSLYLFDDGDFAEEPNLNKSLLELFDGKLTTHG